MSSEGAHRRRLRRGATAHLVAPYRKVLGWGGLCAVIHVLAGLAQPWPLQVVVDHVLAAGPGERRIGLLVAACLSLVGIVGIAAVADYWSTRLLTATGLHLANDLREQLFSHLGRLSLRFHGTQRVGDLTTRVTGDAERAQDLVVQTLSTLVPNALLMIGMFVVMVVLDPVFALIALLATPMLIVVVFRGTRQLKAAAKRARKADGEVAAAAAESLAAMHLVQAFSLEERQQHRFSSLTSTSLRAGLEASRFQARLSPAVDLTAVLSTVLVIGVGALRVLDGALTVGELTVFISYVSSLYKPVKALAKLSNTFTKGFTSLERIEAVLDEQPQITDRPGAPWLARSEGRIELRDVTFSYEGAGSDTKALEHVDLHIRPGETVALVGPTGAGKSTIAQLVSRLVDPTEGAVLIDGVDLRTVALRSVRRQISMVLQDCVLLQGTLRDNIAIGLPGAADFEVERAARLALVHEFADRLPLGRDTPVGERGANLSGGQRQRIAIARAILRDAPILVLDEPTSALDPTSETLIIEALSNLPRNRTTLVVAHRLSTIEHADRILVLERGRIVQQGTHAELMAAGGLYRRFHGAGEVPTPTVPVPPVPPLPLVPPMPPVPPVAVRLAPPTIPPLEAAPALKLPRSLA
ncbi:MAG: ABC transporter ATP-binding protein [Acidimicrobiales bacterium]|nr:ABC transporter ATP-binding protein [Acidimicrobiales bacterium]